MQAAPARYVSVSELYSTDEVELLLDEIRELEPTSCRGEDVQDFEIAGSGCGGLGGAGGGGGRSPAGTELTERSWDSHAHYSARAPRPPLALAPLYCAWRAALSARGALCAALVASGAGACACAWAAAGLRVALPLAWRLRLLLLGALSSLLLHAALLVAHTTLLTRLLPIDWNKLVWHVFKCMECHLHVEWWRVDSACSVGCPRIQICSQIYGGPAVFCSWSVVDRGLGGRRAGRGVVARVGGGARARALLGRAGGPRALPLPRPRPRPRLPRGLHLARQPVIVPERGAVTPTRVITHLPVTPPRAITGLPATSLGAITGLSAADGRLFSRYCYPMSRCSINS